MPTLAFHKNDINILEFCPIFVDLILSKNQHTRLKKNPESQMPNVGIAYWSNRSVVVCISKSKKVWLAIRGTLPAYTYTHIPSTIITQMNLALLQLLGRFF